jgi:predicted MFS family arabinose efflux permease
LLLGRMGGSMFTVTMVLFVLQRYHSPQLAGFTAFLSICPGLVVSPLAGALLDRHGRARLVVLDYLIAAVTLALIGLLSGLQSLPSGLLLAIVGIASLTNPLSNSGARSLFPLIAPRALWERANALDSSGYVVANLVGAPLAGVLVGVVGPEWALASCGAVFAAAAVAMLRLPEPPSTVADGSILRNSWRGLVYVVRNASLRGIALTISTLNIGAGVLVIAVPVLVLGRLHGGPTTVGFIWGAMGAGGLIAALVVGGFSSQGRERQMMAGAILVNAAVIAVLPFAGSLAVVALAIFVLGAANGPLDIALFTLRQRRTDPAWFGRAFAVSMAVNTVGSPVGSALGGPLVAWSLDAALWFAAIVTLVTAVFPLLLVPAHDDGMRASASVRT